MTTAQEAYVWIYGIIDSCNTDFHFRGADALIDLFGVMFPGKQDMKVMLIDFRADKYQDIFKPKA